MEMVLLISSFCISLSKVSLKVETESVGDYNESKGKLLAQVKQMVSLVFCPVCIDSYPTCLLVEYLHNFVKLLLSVFNDLNFAIEACEGVRFITLLGFSPMMEDHVVSPCRIIKTIPQPFIYCFL